MPEETRPLRPIEKPGPEVEVTIRHLAGPLHPTDPDKRGNINFTCPSCKTVLLENSNARGSEGIEMLQCYVCGEYSSGKGLSPQSRE